MTIDADGTPVLPGEPFFPERMPREPDQDGISVTLITTEELARLRVIEERQKAQTRVMNTPGPGLIAVEYALQELGEDATNDNATDGLLAAMKASMDLDDAAVVAITNVTNQEQNMVASFLADAYDGASCEAPFYDENGYFTPNVAMMTIAACARLVLEPVIFRDWFGGLDEQENAS